MSVKKFRVKNFGNEGRGDFVKFCLAPPPQMRVPPQMLPQIPRPGAATADEDPSLQIESSAIINLRRVSTKLNNL